MLNKYQTTVEHWQPSRFGTSTSSKKCGNCKAKYWLNCNENKHSPLGQNQSAGTGPTGHVIMEWNPFKPARLVTMTTTAAYFKNSNLVLVVFRQAVAGPHFLSAYRWRLVTTWDENVFHA